MEFLGTKLSLDELTSIWEMQVRKGGREGGREGGRKGGRGESIDGGMKERKYVVHVVRGGEGVRE